MSDKTTLRGQEILVKAEEQKTKSCACVGPCTGYGTRSNCPPLIVMAAALAEQPLAAAQ